MSSSEARPNTTVPAKNVSEWSLLFILAGAQFVHILDFVILMPMGPQFMKDLSISPQAFSFLVSAYTFSASIWGVIGAFFLDRFDRKMALLVLFAGFTVGTLICGLAPTYDFLLAGRAFAGAFGGLMGAVVFSIVGDVIHESRRGAATGIVMSAFSVAAVVGVPVGLWIAHISWRAPFLGLAVVSATMMVIAMRVLPAMRDHLDTGRAPSLREDLHFILYTPRHWRAYAMIVALMFAAFTVIPFLATYLVRNVGVTERQLPYVYLAGGLATFATARLIGRLADRYGKQRLFVLLSGASVIPILALTHLPRVPFAVALVVTTAFTVLISGRAVPAMSLITSSVESARRGSFMSFTSAIQQMAAGLASLVAGLILTESVDTGELLHYQWVGYMAVGATFVGIVFGRRLKIVGA